MVSTDLQTHMVSLSEIVPYAGNAKEHPEWQVDQRNMVTSRAWRSTRPTRSIPLGG